MKDEGKRLPDRRGSPFRTEEAALFAVPENWVFGPISRLGTDTLRRREHCGRREEIGIVLRRSANHNFKKMHCKFFLF
jgi:hypothetical protein